MYFRLYTISINNLLQKYKESVLANVIFYGYCYKSIRKWFKSLESVQIDRNMRGGYNIKITVLFQNMLVPQNNILEIPKTVRESSGESVFSEDFFYFTGNCFPVK